MAFELMRWAADYGLGTCFYVNRRLLVRQTYDRFRKGIHTGVRAAEFEDLWDEWAPHQICSADTEKSRVIDRGRWSFHDAGLVIVDEAHIQKSQAMDKILDYHKSRGAMVVGLTATPIEMGSWYDLLVMSGTMSEYRDCRALVPAKVYGIEQPDLRKVKRNPTGEYILDGKAKKLYTQSIVGSVFDQWTAKNPDARPAMMFAPGKDESVWLTSEFERRGVPWAHVDATDAIIHGKRYRLTRPLWEDISNEYKAGRIKGISSRFKCLDSETEILTKRGWVSESEFRDDDVVATFTPAGFSVNWERPRRIFRRELCEGEEMFSLDSSGVNCRVTGNHEMLFKSKCERTRSWKKKPAEELHKKAGAYVIPAAGMSSPKGLGLTQSQCEFIGWFITDGSIRSCDVSICQSLVQPAYLHESIRRCLDGCGFIYKCPVYGGDNGYSPHAVYRINKRKNPGYNGLEKYLDKRMPLEVFGEISVEELLWVIKTAYYGDGSKVKNPKCMVRTIELFTGLKELAGNLQALCVVRGIRCSISERAGGYMLYISPGKSVVNVKGCGEKIKCKLRKSPAAAGETVWCVETAAGNIFTRRRGRVCVLGNCREGVDFPSTYHLILATPIGSLASYIQTVGRVLRYSPETPDHVIVTDHGGNYHRHGSPNVDRPWDKWWGFTETAVSEFHTNQIKDKKEPEPICCMKCGMERRSGITCPSCGHTHKKSLRRVIQEDGRIIEVEGNLVRPRYTKLMPDTQRHWDNMFWGYKHKGVKATFNQMAGYFYHLHGYYPPKDLAHMPKNEFDWYARPCDIDMGKLRGAHECAT